MAELSVSRKNIITLFSETKRFIIPDFQRPYSWDIDKCETLWADITNFHSDTVSDGSSEYFLGTIVSYKSEDGEMVIDGQQRITSFFLLLRAFYKKLEEIQQSSNTVDDEADGLMKQIAPCIWDVNQMSKKVSDKTTIHIKSMVVTEKDNDAFHHIMIHGTVKENDDSNYSKNYGFFMGKCNEYAMNNPMDWKQLCLCILTQCIVLPIECNNVDSALTIFSTLNDRGLELSDSDIFKAEMYKMCSSKDEKDCFICKWKELTSTVLKASITIDDIFRYYSHIIRGKTKDKTKEIGLRKFYSFNRFEKLKAKGLIDELVSLADFWKMILSLDDEICTDDAKKMIHCLRCYPNDYWRYPLSVFYYYYKGTDIDWKALLPGFLRKLVSYLFVRFVEYPAVNVIKGPVYQFCIEIASSGTADFSYAMDVTDFTKVLANSSNSKISRAIILLNSYLYADNCSIIPLSFDVEHIFPQSWDSHYFTWTEEEANQNINQYGNKIPLEKKLNISASNGFFSAKKQKYIKSSVTEVEYLLEFSDWGVSEIQRRTNEMCERVVSFFADNLKCESEKKEKLISFEGSSCMETIYRAVLGGKESFILFKKDGDNEYESIHDSYDDAYNSFTPGLTRFGKCTFMDNSLLCARQD